MKKPDVRLFKHFTLLILVYIFMILILKCSFSTSFLRVSIYSIFQLIFLFQKSTPILHSDDSRTEVSWRGDGQLFAITSVNPNDGEYYMGLFERLITHRKFQD